MNKVGSQTIYLFKEGEQTGPFTIAEIRDQMTRGLIDASIPACLAEGGKRRPLVKILSDPEGSLKNGRKIKSIWERIEAIIGVTAIVVAALYVLIVNVASWLHERDSLTAFLALAGLWFLASL